MDQRTIQMLFALLRSAVRGTQLTEEERRNFSPELVQELLAVAAKHDIAHLLALGLKNNDLLSKEDAGIEGCILGAVYRYEQMRHELERLCAALECAEIPFLPLKGSVIRKYYPEAWMRTSCDIDVLVHGEDAEKAVAVLTETCGYTYVRKGSHDHTLFAPNKVHIELHYDLIEDDRAVNDVSEILMTVWNDAAPRAGFAFWHEMSDEMFYFYHIAHMAKHFEAGGCGIRTFLDLWLLDNLCEADKETRDALLRKGNLLTFADAVRKLSRVWFDCEEADPITGQMEDYILRGGVYGNGANRVIVQQQKKGGRVKYILSRLFVPYDVIKFQYPILVKHRWLTPVMEVRRWCRLLDGRRRNRAAKELKYSSNVTDAAAAETQQFLDNIGL